MRILYALLLVISLLPNLASAACPGSMVGASSISAFASGVSGIGTAFIGTGCAAVPVGGTLAPDGCAAADLGGMFHIFSATWVSSAARLAAGTAGGCQFNCAGVGPAPTSTPSPSCFVRASDGMPVELMEFSVGE